MEYFLFICEDPEAEPFVSSEDNVKEWAAEADERGIHIQGNRLRPVEDATLVRRRGGELLVTDGPFAETKETIAGYDILDCDTIEEAIEFASRHPMARFGRIEVRAAWPLEFSTRGTPD